jgi:hypothetical protein
VPSADTSQALNRYAYVKNNPLKFTDPSGHGWFSKVWKKIKPWVGTIVTVGLMMFGVPYPIAATIGNGVQTVVNGGSFNDFLKGEAVIAATWGIMEGTGLSNFSPTGNATVNAAIVATITVSVSVAVSSAVYGRSVWNNFGKAVMYAAITAVAVGVTMEYGGDIIAGAASVIHGVANTAAALASIALNAGMAVINIAAVAVGIAVNIAMLPLRIAGAIIMDIIKGPVRTGTLTYEDIDTGMVGTAKVKQFRFNDLIGYDYTPSGSEIHVGKMTFDGAKRGIFGTLPHESGHLIQHHIMGLFYYVTVVPLTGLSNILRYDLGVENSPVHFFEDDATRRGRVTNFKVDQK